MEAMIQFLKNQGRPLEKALYRYHFENGSKDAVLAALSYYQNKDGGFGHGLEPDFTTKESSPIATWEATKILHELALEKHHPMIQSTLHYLKNTVHQKEGLYYFRIPKNNQYPHAPWWHYHEEKQIEGYNPTASLLGFIHTYSPSSNIKVRIKNAITYFLQHEITEMHELRCFIELYLYIKDDIPSLAFLKTLKSRILKTIEKDPKQWYQSYGVTPLKLIFSKEVPGYKELKDLVIQELEFLHEMFNTHKHLPITWSWDQYPEAFTKAHQAWQSILVYQTLQYTRAFNMYT